MGAWFLAGLLAVAAGCGSPSPFACATSDQCVSGGAHGTCEAQGFCSFADSTCASGRRFEPNAANGLGGTCATGGSGSDAAIDAPADAAIDAPVSLGPITFHQTNATSFDSMATGTVPFTTAVPAHHTIIACSNIAIGANDTLTVTDDAGNDYVAVVGPVTGPQRFYIFAAFDVKPGVTQVTFTASNPANTRFVTYIHDYSGLRGFDVGASQVGTSTAADAMASGATATTWPNDLIFGFGWSSGTATVGTGFTARSTFAANVTEDQIATTAGAHQTIATSATNSWAMLMAAFEGE